MKCKYCGKKAMWLNPIKDYYMCDEHAWEKVKQLQGDCSDKLADTPKDWFIRIATPANKLGAVVKNKD